MKNLLGIYKESGETMITQYTVRQLSDTRSKQLEDYIRNSKTVSSKAFGPRWLNGTYLYALLFGFLLSLLCFFGNGGIQGTLQRVPYLVVIAGVLLVYGITVFIILKVKKRKALKDESYNSFVKDGDSLYLACLDELGIPHDAVSIDFLFVPIKTDKEGNEKVSKFNLINYFNKEMFIYKDKNKLCIALLNEVFELPYDSIKKVEYVKKTIQLPTWNKSESFNSAKYKKYKIKANSTYIICKGYYSVQLKLKGEYVEFFIPDYEFEDFKTVVDLEKRG